MDLSPPTNKHAITTFDLLACACAAFFLLRQFLSEKVDTLGSRPQLVITEALAMSSYPKRCFGFA